MKPKKVVETALKLRSHSIVKNGDIDIIYTFRSNITLWCFLASLFVPTILLTACLHDSRGRDGAAADTQPIGGVLGIPHADENEQLAAKFWSSFLGLNFGDPPDKLQMKMGDPTERNFSDAGGYHSLFYQDSHDKMYLDIGYWVDSGLVYYIKVTGAGVAHLNSKGVSDERLALIGMARSRVVKLMGKPNIDSSTNWTDIYGFTRDDGYNLRIRLSYSKDDICNSLNVVWEDSHRYRFPSKVD